MIMFVSALIASNENKKKVSDDEFMLEMLGYMTVHKDGFKELGFGAQEAEAISRGIKLALEDESLDPLYTSRMAEFQVFMEKKYNERQLLREQIRLAKSKENIAKGKEFFAGLIMDDSIKSTSSGLYYKILKKGKSKRPSLNDSVLVHYKGKRIDGTEFDSSYKRSKPQDFNLQGVVPGFAEGLTLIGEGGKIILYIPSDLAYGDMGQGGIIQPGDTLIFECELIKINP